MSGPTGDPRDGNPRSSWATWLVRFLTPAAKRDRLDRPTGLRPCGPDIVEPAQTKKNAPVRPTSSREEFARLDGDGHHGGVPYRSIIRELLPPAVHRI